MQLYPGWSEIPTSAGKTGRVTTCRKSRAELAEVAEVGGIGPLLCQRPTGHHGVGKVSGRLFGPETVGPIRVGEHRAEQRDGQWTPVQGVIQRHTPCPA